MLSTLLGPELDMLHMPALCWLHCHQPILQMQEVRSPEQSSFRTSETKASSAVFPFLQEYCKFKNTEDSAFPSVYIGLKDKLSGIRRVITDSTVHLVQLLQNYKEKLQDFSKEGEKAVWAVGKGMCVSQSGREPGDRGWNQGE